MYRYAEVAMKRGAGDPSPDYKPTEEFLRRGILADDLEVPRHAVRGSPPRRVM
jgi:hypothetical protein